MANRESVIQGSDIAYDYMCSPCKDGGEMTEATHFCSNCGKQFCDNCLKMHNHLFKKHLVHGADNVSLWSSFSDTSSVSSLSLSMNNEGECKHMCTLHSSEIQTFCRDHDVVCCTVCVATKHRFCKDVQHIPDVARGFSQDRNFQNMLNNVDKLKKKLKQLAASRQRNKEDLHEASAEVISNIKSLRLQLNEILDQLEMKMIEELDRLMISVSRNLQSHIDSSNLLHEEISVILDNIEEKCKVSETYAFISHKRCKEKITEAENLLSSLQEQNYEVHFTPNEEITASLRAISQIGTIKVSPDLRSQPQTKATNVSEVFEIKDACKYRMLTHNENAGEIGINGLAVLPNGSVLAIDNMNNTLKMLNESRRIVAQKRLLNSPHDICAVSDTRAAMTFSEMTKKEIQFVDTSTGKLELQEKLKMKHSCYGIACHDNKLYVSSHTAIYVHAMDGRQERVLYEYKSSKFAIFRFTIADNGKRLYLTNKKSNLLIVIDDNGNRLFMFSDPEMRFPSGITVAGDGSLLVCGYESETVLHIDSEGRRKLATIARSCDGLKSPWALWFCRKTSELIIGGQDDHLFIVTLK